MKIILADAHHIYRRAIKAILESNGFDVVRDVVDIREVVRSVQDVVPDIVVIEPGSGISAIGLAKQLTETLPSIRILFLTRCSEPWYIWEALKAGVSAYVSKEESADVLLSACHAVADGSTYLSPLTVDALALADFLGSGPDSEVLLNSRERDVLVLIAKGKTTKEIASLLRINQKTMESLRRRLMAKVGAAGQVELVRYALRHEPGGIATAPATHSFRA